MEAANSSNLTWDPLTNTTGGSPSRFWFTAIILPLGMIGTVSNGLVITATIISGIRTNPYHAVVISLTLGDFLNCLSSPVFMVHGLWQDSKLERIMCTLPETMRFFFKMHVFYMVAFVAYGRYAISRRLVQTQVSFFSSRLVAIVLTMVIVVNTLVCFVRLNSGCHQYVTVIGTCVCSAANAFVVRVLGAVAFFGCLVLSVYWYGMMYRHVKRVRRILGFGNRHREEVVSKTMFIVLILFLMTSLAAAISSEMKRFTEGAAYEFITVLTPVSSLLVSAAHPWLYGLKSEQVRAMLKRCRRGKRNAVVQPQVLSRPNAWTCSTGFNNHTVSTLVNGDFRLHRRESDHTQEHQESVDG